MPSDIFEENLEIEIGLLEAGQVTVESFPYPQLKPLGDAQKRTFRAVILENSFLRATFLPALGGRLHSLFDKRTGTELLAQRPLELTVGGRRGVRISQGIELHLDGRERLTSLGAVQVAIEEADEGRPAGLWMSESTTGTGLSWHLHFSLPADRAELRCEARIFNRTSAPVPYSGGLLLPALEDNRSEGLVFFTAHAGQGIAVIPDRGSWSASLADESLVFARFDELRDLAPHQLDTWTVSIMPFSGPSSVTAVSREATAFVDPGVIRLQATRPLGNHKLVLLTGSGQTLEAPVKVYPEQILELALPEPVNGFALVNQSKEVLLRWEGDWSKIRSKPLAETTRTRDHIEPSDRTALQLEEETFDIASRHIAHSLLGQRALASGDYDEAEYQFEQALLYNGEDHLTWWMKAVGRRLSGAELEDAPELLNAHFLAPLEPVLRAESFLSQPATIERAPNALLRPMEEFPEQFVEVAAILVNAGFFEQASRWIDEALRHVDLPMLRYLLAYAHLQATNMLFEAGKQVADASKQPLTPPYPWRPIEGKALRALAGRFPNDERLKEWMLLVNRDFARHAGA